MNHHHLRPELQCHHGDGSDEGAEDPSLSLLSQIVTNDGYESADSEDEIRPAESSDPRETKSEQAGLQFSVDRADGLLVAGEYGRCIDVDTPVYVAAVLEYLAAEVLELAGNAAAEAASAMITARHVRSAISDDDELLALLGVVMPQLKSQKKKKKKAAVQSKDGEGSGGDSVRTV